MDEPTPDADEETDADGAVDTAAETDADDAESETDADWMEPVDRRLLEFMQAEDAFEPTQFDDEGICPARYGSYRCRELTKYGLLKQHIPGVYEVTDAGERYLAGDLDPSELEPDE
ncbi:hypothetical protein [Natrinema ejinorense]|uniref:Winged helix-turn-helix domain-containing protein n=1 Tax=Natrinema ejinorense TaxID=373386 RepID=A0A2A5QW21_9EURY|nr:hypothetical protein [Natrinema ejinorense]PCR90949.1 hypothetical protein CP557_10695 [Natrinema ejinorense]